MGLRLVVAACAALAALLLASAGVRAGGGGGAVLFSAVSPDGSGCGPLMLVGADGSAQTVLGRTTCYGIATYSPDGTTLAYYDADAGGIAVVASDGTNRVIVSSDFPLTLAWAGNTSLVWDALGTDALVKSAAIDGSNQQIVCGTRSRDYCTEPTVNPAGTRVAAVYDGAIWTFGLDGSNPTRLTTDGNTAFGDLAPSWSRDGSRIAYVRLGSSGLDLWLMNQDGTNQHALVANCSCLAPTWSHDGTFLLYGAFDSTALKAPALTRVNADGTGGRTLVSGAFISDTPNGIALSPDDGTVFFTGDPAHVESASAVDGSALTQLTSGAGNVLDLALGFTGALAGAPPPPAPNLVLGPQKLGNIKPAGGDELQVGFEFSLKGKHPAATLSFVHTSVTFHGLCTGSGKPVSVTVSIPDSSFLDPAKSGAWYPSADTSADDSYQGQTDVPETLCGAGSSVNLLFGGTFSASVSSGSHLSQPVKVRWHYRTGGGSGKWSKTGTVTPA